MKATFILFLLVSISVHSQVTSYVYDYDLNKKAVINGYAVYFSDSLKIFNSIAGKVFIENNQDLRVIIDTITSFDVVDNKTLAIKKNVCGKMQYAIYSNGLLTNFDYDYVFTPKHPSGKKGKVILEKVDKTGEISYSILDLKTFKLNSYNSCYLIREPFGNMISDSISNVNKGEALNNIFPQTNISLNPNGKQYDTNGTGMIKYLQKFQKGVYQYIPLKGSNYVIVNKNEKWGIMNKETGEVKLKFKYDKVIVLDSFILLINAKF